MEKHKKLVRVVCLVLAALMVMTIGVPLIFAYAETPAEKLERLRKELEDIKSNISAVENSKEKSEQTKQYYQAQANNLKAQLAAIKEDIAAQQQSIELKNAEVAEKAANVAYNKSMFESRLKGMYEMSRQSNLAILLGIDDVSQMLLFAENLQQISEHDTQLVQQLRDEQAGPGGPARRAGAAACGPCRPRAGADRHRRGVFQCHPAGGCSHQRG